MQLYRVYIIKAGNVIVPFSTALSLENVNEFYSSAVAKVGVTDYFGNNQLFVDVDGKFDPEEFPD